MRLIKVLALVICLAFTATGLSGCAQVLRGSHQDVLISTDPAGVWAEENGQGCQTPCVLSLSRQRDHLLHFSLDGYEPATVRLAQELRADWLLIDLLIWGPFVLVDLGGGLWDLGPNPVYARLQPVKDGAVSLRPITVAVTCARGRRGECAITSAPSPL